jgi:hypothetical protein
MARSASSNFGLPFPVTPGGGNRQINSARLLRPSIHAAPSFTNIAGLPNGMIYSVSGKGIAPGIAGGTTRVGSMTYRMSGGAKGR